MLSGKLVSRLWLRSRSVLVPKKDNTPRPLGIGDAWYRLVGKASLTKIGARVGGALYPHQLGVAIKNGCEMGGRTAQMAFDAGENLGLLALDNDNAFNTMPHGEICTGLVEYAPELLAFFHYAYRDPSCWNITSSTVIQLHNALSYALIIRGLKKGAEVIFV